MTNVNLETGIRYGVVSGHNANALMEDIFDRGEDDSYNAFRDETIAQITAALEGLDCVSSRGDEAIKRIATDTFEALEESSIYYHEDEAQRSYTDARGNKFQLSYLGGAPLIWCIKTSKIVNVKSLCSPCVPNAGDLDSGLTDEASGYECYGIPDEYLDDDDNA